MQNELQQSLFLGQNSASVQSHVLSIQSSVVYGYVGNRSAIFPLQLHGVEADPLNTCQMSNHSGYEHFRGHRTSADELGEMLEGMRLNGLLAHYTHVLSGYIASEPFLLKVRDAIALIRSERNAAAASASSAPARSVGDAAAAASAAAADAAEGAAEGAKPAPLVTVASAGEHPGFSFMCDPVMGDDGALYVPESFVSIYRDSIVPLADIITPNQTEAELLTGLKITDIASARQACAALHALGPRVVIITSAVFAEGARRREAGDKPAAGEESAEEEDPLEVDVSPSYSERWVKQHPEADIHPSLVHTSIIHAIASQRHADGTTTQHHLRLPRYPIHIVGTGDLVSSLVFAHLIKGNPLATAVERAMAAAHCVIRKTVLLGRTELALVQSQREIVSPDIDVFANPLE